MSRSRHRGPDSSDDDVYPDISGEGEADDSITSPQARPLTCAELEQYTFSRNGQSCSTRYVHAWQPSYGIHMGLPTSSISQPHHDIGGCAHSSSISTMVGGVADSSHLVHYLSYNNPSYKYEPATRLPYLDASSIRNYNCCGLTLPSLDHLLAHDEAAHTNASEKASNDLLKEGKSEDAH